MQLLLDYCSIQMILFPSNLAPVQQLFVFSLLRNPQRKKVIREKIPNVVVARKSLCFLNRPVTTFSIITVRTQSCAGSELGTNHRTPRGEPAGQLWGCSALLETPVEILRTSMVHTLLYVIRIQEMRTSQITRIENRKPHPFPKFINHGPEQMPPPWPREFHSVTNLYLSSQVPVGSCRVSHHPHSLIIFKEQKTEVQRLAGSDWSKSCRYDTSI